MDGSATYLTGLSKKDWRCIERDVATLFSIRAILVLDSLERAKKVDLYRPTVRLAGGMHFVSDAGRDAIGRISDLCCNLPEIAGLVTEAEIYTQVLRTYNDLLNNRLLPTGQEFVDAIARELLNQVKDHGFLVEFNGVDLAESGNIVLGNARVEQGAQERFERLNFGIGPHFTMERAYERFKDKVWLVSVAKGSPGIALEKFEGQAVIAAGILALSGVILIAGSIRRHSIYPCTSHGPEGKTASLLSWDIETRTPKIRYTWSASNLRLDQDALNYLRENCYLDELSTLIDQPPSTELEQAIVRAIYWFAEASRDKSALLKFIKLWTCAESFFAIEKDEVTEQNARGVTAVLAFAGYRVIPEKDYSHYKAKAKRFYEFRSKALHRGHFRHVEDRHLDEFSQWIGWLIVSMMSLSCRGYKSLDEVKREAIRLDSQISGV